MRKLFKNIVFVFIFDAKVGDTTLIKTALSTMTLGIAVKKVAFGMISQWPSRCHYLAIMLSVIMISVNMLHVMAPLKKVEA